MNDPLPDGAWERRDPQDAGIDPGRLAEAINFSTDPAHAGSPRDLGCHLVREHTLKHDDGVLHGPTQFHGLASGVVVRNGYLVAEWGDPLRADMTFSVSKTFLSTVAGLAWDRGLIKDLDEPVGATVRDGGYSSDHNSQITWDHSLRQLTEWDGTLWEKHYSAGNPDDELLEPVTPGTRFEYNDVRVNRFALSLLRTWKEPLPKVLQRDVMGPIGASDSWHWHGYANSWVEVEGRRIQSVSGGGHWGGGMWISAHDLARLGHLTLRYGRWGDRQILSEDWISKALTPTLLQPTYGFMNYFLNTGGELFPSGRENHFYHGGAGANRVWVAPELDIVVVVRWMSADCFDGFVEQVLAAVS